MNLATATFLIKSPKIGSFKYIGCKIDFPLSVFENLKNIISDVKKLPDITKKYFASQDQNQMVLILKIVGTIVSIISGIILCNIM